MKGKTVWAVKVSYHYGEESYRNELETDVKLYATQEEAVKGLERVIREDWTAEVDGQSLADLRGQSETGSDKYSEWLYSEDGTIAWSFYSDGHGYKGEVVELTLPEDLK